MNEQLKTFLSVLLTSLVDLRKFGFGDGHSYSYVLGMLRAAEVSGVLTYEQASSLRDILVNAANHARKPFPCEENAGPCMPIVAWWERHKAALEVKAGLANQPVHSAEPFEGDSEFLEPCPTCEGNGEVDGWPCVRCSGSARVPSSVEAIPAVIHMGGYDFVDASQVKPQAQDSANEKSEPVPAPTPRRSLRLLCVLVKSKLDPAQGAYLPIHTMHRMPPRAMVKGQWSEPRYSGLHLRETYATAPTASVLERCLPKLHLRANGRFSVLGVNA